MAFSLNCALSSSGSPAGIGAAAAQSAETHLAACQRSVPGVAAAADARHAAHWECAVLRTAAAGGGDQEEGPGTSDFNEPENEPNDFIKNKNKSNKKSNSQLWLLTIEEQFAGLIQFMKFLPIGTHWELYAEYFSN